MCWFTLTPIKDKNHKRHSSDSSCAEDLVRVHHKSSPRFSDIKVKIPSSVTMDLEHQQHHHHPHLHPPLHHHHHHHLHHPHLHPLHLHPVHNPLHHHHLHGIPGPKLRGQGRKRSSPSPAPPPPSQVPSTPPPHSHAPSAAPPSPREPVYRTQIVEPATVRETTRVALRSTHTDREQSRLRRVAGYEVLGRELPWQWDCVSSTVGSSSAGGRGKWTRRRGRGREGGLKYPPFGAVEKWM
ncbi:hypothetical protein NX059_004880 [Plenodomus lindquistii]|nr:hypothetical protein NX059_004880 [Plenodomus lindquistii]